MNDILIFNKQAQSLKQQRAAKYAKHNDYNFLQRWAQKEIKERLSLINRNFNQIFDLDSYITETEILPLEKNTYDLVKSILHLHTTNDLPGILAQIQNSLRPDGLFFGCLFGGETLYELRDCLQQAEMELTGGLTPRIHPFADKQDIGALMQRTHYALPVIDSEKIIVTYDNIFKLMHDLRYMGESNTLMTRTKKFTSRSLFLKANEIYLSKYTDETGRIEATFEIIFAHAWKPHDSQQKPLKPGSAKMRMADALKSKEKKLPC